MDYNKLLEKARKTYSECVTGAEKRRLESIFPELAESEDERIRKEVEKAAKDWYKENYEGENPQGKALMISAYIDGAIAWLEKQDPKKHEEELEKAYKCADKAQYRKGYEDAKCEIEKQGEQKPAWSEEDERMYKAISIALSLNDAKGYLRSWYTTPEEADNWLKSLKPQPQWKPTDEQMQSLYFAIITYSKKDDCKLTYDSLNSLYNELKKL